MEQSKRSSTGNDKMKHTQLNCSSCNRELLIKVAKGENTPDKIMCKACSQGEPHTPRKVTMKLGDALKVVVGARRVMRCEHRDKNFVLTGKHAPTVREEAQKIRIYGSE